MSVQEALVKFQNKEVSYMELAKFVGFNEDELIMIEVFWEPVFNKT